MTQKDNFAKQVVQALQTAGFKDLFSQNQHQQFIQMIAATFFSNQLQYDGMIQYLADVVENEQQRKKIAEIIKEVKTLKVQKKPQQQKQKQEKAEKKPQKKTKVDYIQKPKQSKGEKVEGTKQQGQVKNQEGEQVIGGQKKGLKQQLENSGKTKCRFFPFCKNPETCEYFHPTDKVTISQFIE